MTGSEDNSSTRPISVAELLARNGTIGAPPVGGRRRRRRGNADAVTVAELTGEIPIIRPDDPPPTAAAVAPVAPPVEEPVEASPTDVDEAPSTNGAVDHVVELDEAEPDEAEPEPEPEAEAEPAADESADTEVDAEAEADDDDISAEDLSTDGDVHADTADTADTDDDDYADAVAEYSARLEQRGPDPEATEEEQPTRRFGLGRFGRKDPSVDAEKWTPDPVDDSDPETGVAEDAVEPVEIEELDDQSALDSEVDDKDDHDGEADDRDELPSYLRSTEEPLFGGQTVADDLARRGRRSSVDDIDLDEQDDDFDADDEPRRMSSVVHGAWIVGQSVIAVVFGAGLFVAFDQLWKWNNIVALVLSVLVILGLVVGVRVVRKTEDIGSTLIAVAVGALVTLGPLALLQSG